MAAKLSITVELQPRASLLIAECIDLALHGQDDIVVDATTELFEVLQGQLLDQARSHRSGLLVLALTPIAETALYELRAVLGSSLRATVKAARIHQVVKCLAA